MVIWRDTPKNILKIKKIAILLSLKSLKALSPRVSERDFPDPPFTNGQLGRVKEYMAKTRLRIPEVQN